MGMVGMHILVTGAAGYIGSFVTRSLLNEGYQVIALDNLQQGHREAVHPDALFLEVDLCDVPALKNVFKQHPIQAVVHLAAVSFVGESVVNPRKYFQSNLVYGLNLLDAMLEYKVPQLVFSSSAAVYGSPDAKPIREDQPVVPPLNPYGESKLIFERILQRYEHAYGLRYIALRYFNAAGADESLGEDHEPETHLIPNVLKVALGQCEALSVFGTDYPTHDGTCVRDYVHVADIAKAHVTALRNLGSLKSSRVYNLANGRGFSVLEIIEAANRVTGIKIPVVYHPRRQGDPACLIASAGRAKSELGWQPARQELEDIVQSAWVWQKKHPYGY